MRNVFSTLLILDMERSDKALGVHCLRAVTTNCTVEGRIFVNVPQLVSRAERMSGLLRWGRSVSKEEPKQNEKVKLTRWYRECEPSLPITVSPPFPRRPPKCMDDLPGKKRCWDRFCFGAAKSTTIRGIFDQMYDWR